MMNVVASRNETLTTHALRSLIVPYPLQIPWAHATHSDCDADCPAHSPRGGSLSCNINDL